MKDLLKVVFLVGFVVLIYVFRNDIIYFVYNKIIYRSNVLSYNEYFLNNDYEYFKIIDSDKVKNKEQLLDMLYTIIDSGDDSYAFYCDYPLCTSDVKLIIDNEDFLPTINNFVHPYNSFETVNVDITALDRITITVKKVYSEYEIEYINRYIADFIENNITDSLSDYDKIKKFHDHIINLYEYDEEKSNKSYSAYNLITKKRAICGGYSDLIAIYLNHLGIKNYKISSEAHIWNLVYLDGTWYHLDATWDDPVASDGKPHLLHNFFMISTDVLHKLDSVEHNFDTSIYLEAN